MGGKDRFKDMSNHTEVSYKKLKLPTNSRVYI